jgi:hypothetical protein
MVEAGKVVLPLLQLSLPAGVEEHFKRPLGKIGTRTVVLAVENTGCDGGVFLPPGAA